MIYLKLNEEKFEYDIRGLLTSFYPGEDIDSKPEHMPENKEALAEGDMLVDVDYKEKGIALSFIHGERTFEKEIAVNWEDAKETKSALKRLVYEAFSGDTGKNLPWGTLTGIRPTKIPMSLLDKKTDDEIFEYMKNNYLVSEEKNRLGIEIAKREKEILKNIDYEEGYSLYIGIPFCPTTCLYCSFTSYPMTKWKPRMHEYLDALFREIDYTAETFKGKKLNTIYIGGGTPTSLEPEHMDRLLDKVQKSFDLRDLQEWTVEAGRPDSVTREKLQVMRNYPVDRISINPQTMKAETLKIIGRRHTPEQIEEAYAMAREEGFDNINMDLIMGLPEETIEDVHYTMEKLKAMDPDNITVHSLAIKRAARLNTMKEQYAHLKMENTEDMMNLTAKYCREMGLEPYYLYRQKNMAGNFENVGYAKPGKAGIYNILIMEEMQTIMALGAGSTTKRVKPGGIIERCSNVKDIDLYLQQIDEMIDRKRKLLF